MKFFNEKSVLRKIVCPHVIIMMLPINILHEVQGKRKQIAGIKTKMFVLLSSALEQKTAAIIQNNKINKAKYG